MNWTGLFAVEATVALHSIFLFKLHIGPKLLTISDQYGLTQGSKYVDSSNIKAVNNICLSITLLVKTPPIWS